MMLAETVFQSIDASLTIITFLFVVALIGLFVLTSRVYRLLKATKAIAESCDKMIARLDASVAEAKKQSADLAAMRRYYETPVITAGLEYEREAES